MVYITARVSGNFYFVIGRGHAIIGSFRDFMVARRALHSANTGHYIMRGDGVVLAYMSTESGSRMPAKIPKELKRQVALWAGVKKVSRSDQHHEDATPSSPPPRRGQGS